MNEAVNDFAVENFMTSMDYGLPKEVHMNNALLDYWSYGWSVETLNTIWSKIREEYYVKHFMDKLFAGEQNAK